MDDVCIEKEDAVVFLKNLKIGSIDLMIIDPAWEAMEKHRSRGTTTRLKKSKSSSNEWFPIFDNGRLRQLFYYAYRAMNKNSHLYIFADDESMFLSKPIVESSGFKFWKNIVWDYENMGMGYHWRSRHQNILFFEKGKKTLNDFGKRVDVIRCKSVSRKKNAYPTEKPTDVYKELIDASSNENDIVCDTFLGSGVCAEAAISMGRRFIGCDISSFSIDLTKKRISVLKK
jgi:site-specific DNA-methyltransferase (adenine-specific)